MRTALEIAAEAHEADAEEGVEAEKGNLRIGIAKFPASWAVSWGKDLQDEAVCVLKEIFNSGAPTGREQACCKGAV